MKKYILLFAAIALPLLLCYLYYTYYSESGSFWSIQCGFHKLTGLQCPGCGGQRSLYHILHGDILFALRNNALFVICIPFLLHMYYGFIQLYVFKNKRSLNRFSFSTQFIYILIVVVIVFFIVRNIPFEPFIYLSPAN